MLFDLSNRRKRRLPYGETDEFRRVLHKIDSGFRDKIARILADVIVVNNKARDNMLYTQSFSEALKQRGLFERIVEVCKGSRRDAYRFSDIFVWAQLMNEPSSRWFVVYGIGSGYCFGICFIRRPKKGLMPRPRFPHLTDELVVLMGAHPDYKSYIKSDGWKARRRPALERAGGRCERPDCNRADGLSVHHKHYETLGAERPEDLEVLCAIHHAEADRQRAADTYDRIREQAFIDAHYDLGGE